MLVYIVLFSELKLPAPSSWVYLKEKINALTRVYVILQRGQDGAKEINPFCAPVGSPGSTEPIPWLPGVGIPFPRGSLLLSSPAFARNLLFARTSSLEIRRIFSKFYSL